MAFKAPKCGHGFATLSGVTRFRTLWDAALHQRLITLPRLTASHELPRSSVFRSLTLRLLWGFWMRFLAPGGRYFFVATILFLFYGAVSFEIQAFVPLAYACAVWFFALFSMALEKPRVALSVHHEGRVAVGETLPVDVEVTGAARRVNGESAVVPHRLPVEIGVEPPDGAPLPALSPGQSARVRFQLRGEKRGVYALRGYRVATDFPFGLVNATRVFSSTRTLTVTPHFEPLERLDLPLGRRNQAGSLSFAASRGESGEYIGNRDYREGDAIRDIDWRATARLSRPIVREYREEIFVSTALVLDTQIAATASTADEREADFERAISLCAACGEFLNRAEFRVEFLAAGTDFHALQAGQGPVSLDEILGILAGVQSSRQTSWDELWSRLEANLSQLTSVVCVFLDWDEARRTLALQLAQSGLAVKCVVVRSEAPALDPLGSWAGEVPVLGPDEFLSGVRQF